jgi:hypothetical protein
MSFFGWFDDDSVLQAQKHEERIAHKEKLHELTAYRRNLERLIHENMSDYLELDREHLRVSHAEDTLRDELGKMPK